MKDKPEQVEIGEWKYLGCVIQKNSHPKLYGNYEVFVDDENETHLDRTYTFTEAKTVCKEKNKIINKKYFYGH